MDIIQVVKGDTGPQLKATVTRSDTGAAFVGSGTIALRIRKKGTTTVESTVALDSTLSDLSQGSLVFPLENFLDTGIFTVSALTGGNLTITAHGLPNSKTGASFKWNSTGTDPSNVTSGSSYFIICECVRFICIDVPFFIFKVCSISLNFVYANSI